MCLGSLDVKKGPNPPPRGWSDPLLTTYGRQRPKLWLSWPLSLPAKKTEPFWKGKGIVAYIYITERPRYFFKHSQILNGTYDFDEIWQVGCLGESATGMGGYLKIATQGRALHPLSPKNFFEKGSFLKIHQKSQKIPSDILTVATCQPTIHVSLMTLVFPIFQITYAWRGVLQNFFLRFLWLVFRI